jgi:hypothetical protein
VSRLKEFIQGFLEAEKADAHAAMIGHGGLYRMALPYVLENISPRFAFANIVGYGQLIVAQAEGGQLLCVDWDGIRPSRGRPQ